MYSECQQHQLIRTQDTFRHVLSTSTEAGKAINNLRKLLLYYFVHMFWDMSLIKMYLRQAIILIQN